MRRAMLLALGMLLLLAVQASAQWYLYYDGSVDPRATPCLAGWQSVACRWDDSTTKFAAFGPDTVQWRIVPNDSNGHALQMILNPAGLTDQARIEWQPYGGPGTGEIKTPPMCGTSGWADYLPGTENGVTMCYRFRVDSWPTAVAGNSIKWQRGQFYFNKLRPDGTTYYKVRPIFKLRYAGDGDPRGPLTINNERSGANWPCRFNFGEWHEVWVRLIPDVNSNNVIQYGYFDGALQETFAQDSGGNNNFAFAGCRDKGQVVTFSWDYFAVTPGDYEPGTLPLPGERVGASGTIGEVKSKAEEGGRVSIGRAIVASIITDPFDPNALTFFAEDPDNKGVAGAKVIYDAGFPVKDGNGSDHTLAVGDLVSIEGGLCSRQCEATIRADRVTFLGAQPNLIGPGTVGTANRSVSASYTSQLKNFVPPQIVSSPLTAPALRTDGLLMTLWGTVTEEGLDFFYLDDGTGMCDETVFGGDGEWVKGIRCIPLPGVAMPWQNSSVSVVGCVGTCRAVDATALPPLDKIVPCIWVSEVNDNVQPQ